jgi:tetratricopeptide (TPR) repeat protein
MVYHALGQYQRAIACLEQTLRSLEDVPYRERFGFFTPPAAASRLFLTWCHAELGLFAAGRAWGDEGVRIAEAVEYPGSLLLASWGVGWLALRQGDLASALPQLERAMGLCREADLPAYFPVTAAALGTGYTLTGRVVDAVPLLTQALAHATAMETVDDQVFCGLALGETHLRTGHLEEAQTCAERARTLARAHQARGDEAYALYLLGEIATHREPPEAASAETHYQHAFARTSELGMRPLQAHCHRGLGTWYATSGQPERARAELSAAIALYRDMAMTFWLPQAEAVLAQVERQ